MNILEHVPLDESASAPLYHGTSFHGAMQILRQGNIEASDKRIEYDEEDGGGYYNISLTRDPRLRYYHVDGEDKPGTGPVVFVLDQNKLRQNFKMKPYDFTGLGRRASGGEAEEQVLTQEIDIKRYVTAIQLHSLSKTFAPNDEDIYEIGFDPDNDSEAKMKRELSSKINKAFAAIAAMAERKGIKVVDLRRKSPVAAIIKSNIATIKGDQKQVLHPNAKRSKPTTANANQLDLFGQPTGR